MVDTSFVSETAALLADLKTRLRPQGEQGERALRRGVAMVAVAVVHILFLYLLILSQWFPQQVPLIAEQAPMAWISLLGKSEAPKPAPPSPKEKAPTTLPTALPPPTVVRPKEEENNAIDWGLAIGRSLACGANSYEYLSPKRQAACMHRPWAFTYDRFGNIVLVSQAPPVQEDKFRPSDAQARERYTTPQCPKNIDPNAPCLSAIIGGHP